MKSYNTIKINCPILLKDSFYNIEKIFAFIPLSLIISNFLFFGKKSTLYDSYIHKTRKNYPWEGGQSLLTLC